MLAVEGGGLLQQAEMAAQGVERDGAAQRGGAQVGEGVIEIGD
jgi:hypothetical protein